MIVNTFLYLNIRLHHWPSTSCHCQRRLRWGRYLINVWSLLTGIPVMWKQCLVRPWAADLVLQCFMFFTGNPKEIMRDNHIVITNDFYRSLCERMGIGTHKGVIHRPSSNGRAENAVKLVVNVL